MTRRAFPLVGSDRESVVSDFYPTETMVFVRYSIGIIEVIQQHAAVRDAKSRLIGQNRKVVA